MKLHKIKLTNFRQFKGTQTINLSSDGRKNVTVIYGENGRGKTGIFRALLFCLYGDLSLSQDELSGEKKKKGLLLINEVLLKDNMGSSVKASVSIEFGHKNKKYEITRSISGLMKEGGEIIQDNLIEVELQITDENGNSLPPEKDPENVRFQIQEILNARLRDYFLFDGERIERLTRNTQERREEVQKGIRTLLDLDAMELAIQGLEKLDSKIEKEIKNKSTGKLQIVSDLIIELSNKINDLKEKQAKDIQESKRLEHHIKKISDKISENKETAEQERKRQKLIVEKSEKLAEKDQNKIELAELLNKSSQLVSNEIIVQLQEELDLYREKGELPPAIRKEFVENLLNLKKCICGTSLDEHHTKERENLISFMEKTFKPGLGKQSEDILHRLNRITCTHGLLSDRFNRLLMKHKKFNDEILDLESRITFLRDELGSGGTSIDDLIQERKKSEEELEDLRLDIERRIDKIKNAEEEREDKDKEATVLKKQQKHLKNLTAKQELTKEACLKLIEIYDTFAEEVKIQLARKILKRFISMIIICLMF